ncbi:hypothetical protein FOCC_FOCC007331 [Frankliniella occidentalis]|nr:hypothetical protein FOCC_FOCC007331 [Frankliniella occidentalis]
MSAAWYREKDDFNHNKLKQNIDPTSRTRLPVAKITAKISQKKGTVSLSDTDTLEKDLFLSKGSKIMLRTNLWVEKGLVNGSVGTVIDIIYHPDATPQEDPPAVLICNFESYKGPYLDLDLRTIPIGPTQLSHENAQGKKYTVSQFPVCLNYACTIYKSQGLTLEKASDGQHNEEYDPFTEMENSQNEYARPRTINTLSNIIIQEKNTKRYASVSP